MSDLTASNTVIVAAQEALFADTRLHNTRPIGGSRLSDGRIDNSGLCCIDRGRGESRSGCASSRGIDELLPGAFHTSSSTRIFGSRMITTDLAGPMLDHTQSVKASKRLSERITDGSNIRTTLTTSASTAKPTRHCSLGRR